MVTFVKIYLFTVFILNGFYRNNSSSSDTMTNERNGFLVNLSGVTTNKSQDKSIKSLQNVTGRSISKSELKEGFTNLAQQLKKTNMTSVPTVSELNPPLLPFSSQGFFSAISFMATPRPIVMSTLFHNGSIDPLYHVKSTLVNQAQEELHPMSDKSLQQVENKIQTQVDVSTQNDLTTGISENINPEIAVESKDDDDPLKSQLSNSNTSVTDVMTRNNKEQKDHTIEDKDDDPGTTVIKVAVVCLGSGLLILAARKFLMSMYEPDDYKTAWRNAYSKPHIPSSSSIVPTTLGRSTRDVEYQPL